MKIAIVDTQTTGHHFEYIYNLYSEINKRDSKNKIDIYCDDKLYSYIKKNRLREIEKPNKFRIKSDRLEQPKGNWIKKTKIASKNIRKLKNYDQIIFLNLNIYFTALLLNSLFNKPSFSFSGIYFSPHIRLEGDKMSWLRDYVLKRISKNYKCNIFVLNDLKVANRLNKRYSTTNFSNIADPIPKFYYQQIDTSSESKDEKTTFAMLGSISERKGIFEFLKAIELSNRKGQFIIAGNVDNSISRIVERKINLLKSEGFNIKLYNRYLSNKEFANFIIKSDILVMSYHTKGSSSGILGHAALNNIAVIGPEKGLLANTIKDYQMGVTVNPNNTDQFVKYLNNPRKVKSVYDAKKVEAYVSENSIKDFYTKIMSI